MDPHRTAPDAAPSAAPLPITADDVQLLRAFANWFGRERVGPPNVARFHAIVDRLAESVRPVTASARSARR